MLTLITQTFKSIFFTYKNIFHFILSKILIILLSLLIWFFIIFPFWLILILTIYLFDINYLIIDFLRNLLILMFLYFSFFNFKLLFSKLSLKYVDWKKMKFSLKKYFNLKHIIKNFYFSLISLFWFIIISCAFIIIFWILILIYWWINNINNLVTSSITNSFSVISLIFFILYLIFISYFLYRIYFSFYILLESENKPITKIIKKSIQKTKWFFKFLKLLLILLIFLIILFPYNYFSQLNDYKLKNIKNYIKIKNKIILNQIITEKEKIDYLFLKKEFWTINNEKLVEKYNKSNRINILYFVLHFVFIFWIFDLVFASFYKKEIK